MTDPESGYDIKITRSGKGKMDTNYTVTACPKGKNPKASFIPEIDLEKIVRDQMLSYEELEEKLSEFLNGADKSDDDEEEVAPKKDKKKKKKVKGGDI